MDTVKVINDWTGKPWCSKCSCLGCPGGFMGHAVFTLDVWYSKKRKELKAWYKALGKPKLHLLEDIEIDGIDTRDYPDFCDAFIAGASYKGRELTESELEWINDTHSDFVYDCVIERIY